ncbi:MAG: hypothetical protein J5U17_07515 [Candidatus Methanoperedens sp.]|nr:hypothetical protein [Candidatus Methanoperedens sp.]MCE8427865.1 hypothetical protein [Candidatus Methanoperedens sp.]
MMKGKNGYENQSACDARILCCRSFLHIKILLFVAMTVLFLANPSAATDSLIILNSSNIPTMMQNINYIESLGGTITHRFPLHILIGDIPESRLNNLTGHMNIVEVATTAVDVSALAKDGKTAQIAANSWNDNYMGQAAGKDLISIPAPEPGPIVGDMLILPGNIKRTATLTQLPDNQINQASIQPYMAGFYDTSEYMIGDVAVGIIFLESNGLIDANIEDWNSTEESNVISKIQAGLKWWAAKEPKAKLTFTYDIHYQIPTSYEPITRPANPSGANGGSLWVADAMSDLGYSKYPSYFDNVYDYENSIRKLADTDWAFTIFVVDSSKDSDGLFADGYFAYAYLGGPFLVMTYDNDGYGIANMDAVIAHEGGHIFYALDQYTSANSPCSEASGYLGIQNQNSAYPFPGACISNVGSIMRSQVSPYTNGLLDAYAREQVGWRDSNTNGILDIMDFFPSSTLNAYIPDPTNDNTPTYTGSSSTILTYPNMNPSGLKHNITINKIANVQWREDGGIWTIASPAEGLFDSSIEGFTFTVPQLSDGTHTIEVRALNTAGNWETAYANDTITIETPPDSITDLHNTTYSQTYINWTWNDPSNSDFDHVEVYLNGTFKINVFKGLQFYNATGLTPATLYNISTRTVDTAGNINQTWVNKTARTAPVSGTTYSISLSSGWNLISIPLNLSTWILGDESAVGNPLNVTPVNCLSSIYRFNSTSKLFEKSDHITNWGWWPAAGPVKFTELEPGRGYWVMANIDCDLTLTGIAPSDLDIPLEPGWNLIGWYSMKESVLGQESVEGNPLNVTPSNSLTSIYRFNSTSKLFEKSDHIADWGWWPAAGPVKFTELEPGRGYWVNATNEAVWRHKS